MSLAPNDSMKLSTMHLYGDRLPSRPLDVICATIANKISRNRRLDQRALDADEAISGDDPDGEEDA